MYSITKLDNKLMIQLQVYLNSSANLQRRDNSRLRKNMLLYPGRRVMKSVSEAKARYQGPEVSKNESSGLTKSRSRYEQLMKLIREPIKLELRQQRSSPQKQTMQICKSINFKTLLRPRLDSELSIQRLGVKKIVDQDNQTEDRREISTTATPSYVADKIQTQQCVRKYSIKTEAQQQKATAMYKKPRTTILKRILDPRHLKHVRQLISSNVQGSNKDVKERSQNGFELKCSYEALQRLKKQYEFKPMRRQKSKGKLGKLLKMSSLNRSSGQNIAGWTIKQFTD